MDIHQLHFLSRQHGAQPARHRSGDKGWRVLAEQVLLRCMPAGAASAPFVLQCHINCQAFLPELLGLPGLVLLQAKARPPLGHHETTAAAVGDVCANVSLPCGAPACSGGMPNEVGKPLV